MCKLRNINLEKLSNHVRNKGFCTEEASLYLMDEIALLRKELSVGWQKAFYGAQDTIEIQKREIATLQSLVSMMDGQCEVCGCVPATQVSLCEEHRDILTDCVMLEHDRDKVAE